MYCTFCGMKMLKRDIKPNDFCFYNAIINLICLPSSWSGAECWAGILCFRLLASSNSRQGMLLSRTISLPHFFFLFFFFFSRKSLAWVSHCKMQTLLKSLTFQGTPHSFSIRGALKCHKSFANVWDSHICSGVNMLSILKQIGFILFFLHCRCCWTSWTGCGSRGDSSCSCWWLLLLGCWRWTSTRAMDSQVSTTYR